MRRLIAGVVVLSSVSVVSAIQIPSALSATMEDADGAPTVAPTPPDPNRPPDIKPATVPTTLPPIVIDGDGNTTTVVKPTNPPVVVVTTKPSPNTEVDILFPLPTDKPYIVTIDGKILNIDGTDIDVGVGIQTTDGKPTGVTISVGNDKGGITGGITTGGTATIPGPRPDRSIPLPGGGFYIGGYLKF